MGETDFTNLLAVAAIAFTAPLLLGLAPAVRVPAVVLEIVAGIVVGPSVLGWVWPPSSGSRSSSARSSPGPS